MAILLAAIVVLCASCWDTPADHLEDVPEGKLAPPGSTLAQEEARDGSPFALARFQREYRSDLQPAEIFAYFNTALAVGWERRGPETLDGEPPLSSFYWKSEVAYIRVSVSTEVGDDGQRRFYVTTMEVD